MDSQPPSIKSAFIFSRAKKWFHLAKESLQTFGMQSLSFLSEVRISLPASSVTFFLTGFVAFVIFLTISLDVQLVQMGSLQFLQFLDQTADATVNPFPRRVHAVCVVAVVGNRQFEVHPSAARPPPYGRLQRLVTSARLTFQNLPVEYSGRVHVLTDDRDILCRMFGDEFGTSMVDCTSFAKLLQEGGKKATCQVLIAGSTSEYISQIPVELGVVTTWNSVRFVDLDSPVSTPAVAKPWTDAIVTAFSANHLEAGLYLMRSISYFHGTTTEPLHMVVYGMHLTKDEMKRVECVAKYDMGNITTEVRDFPFKLYPDWMDVNVARGEYAWKAIMVHEVLSEFGTALWLDGGDRLRGRNAVPQAFTAIREKGFVGGASSGTIERWTHPLELDYLQVPAELNTSLPNCGANKFGLSLDAYQDVARPWFECALVRQCIAPLGSSRLNHRQDQAALTVIVNLANRTCVGWHREREIVGNWDHLTDKTKLETLIAPTQCSRL